MEKDLIELGELLARLRDEHGIQSFCSLLIPPDEIENYIYGKDEMKILQGASSGIESFLRKRS